MSSRTQSFRRAILAGTSCGIAFVLSATTSAAKESKRAVCSAAYGDYKSAIEREKAGQQLEARALYAACAEAAACGGLVPKCKARHQTLVSKIPTVVPVVTDEKGTLLVDVDVAVDGRPLTSHLDGKGLPVETGAHTFTFRTDQGIATQNVMVIEGQHDREIAVSIGGPKPTPSKAPASGETKARAATTDRQAEDETADNKPSHGDSTQHEDSTQHADPPRDQPSRGGSWAMPSSVFPYLLGVVGLAGVAGGGLLTYWGNQDNNLLRSSCGASAQCRPSSVDHIKKLYLGADISYGVGAAALAITTFVFANSRSHDPPVKPVAHDALVLGVEPMRSGGFASLSGSF
jgi:hypothetical protein